MGPVTDMKPVYFVLFFVCGVCFGRYHARSSRNARSEYKMCVAEPLLSLCEDMSSQETKSLVKIICIPARDRMECIEKIKKRQADFNFVTPEDMYVAKNIADGDFAVFEEVRTKEEPEAEFRYEAVAVVHKDFNITSIKDLKGLNSCHTGIGRNVGYKIPITKLKQKGIIGNLADPKFSPRENELKALSTLFSKACIVGKWSLDQKIDVKLKRKYSNLCALCEHPEICDYPDGYSGYDGALRCLVHNGGEIAWTKVIFVRKFFGLSVGISPSKPTNEDASQYSYLCQDGSKVPVTETPCTWAARPWQGYMTHAAVAKSVDNLRRKIENLAAIGSKSHAPWFEKVLEMNDKSVAKDNKIISPGDYLDKANYTDVIERDYGPPYKTIRFCVTSQEEKEKCQILTQTAFSRDVRPRFDCVLEKTQQDCLKTIRDNGADIIALDSGSVYEAMADYNLAPILSERTNSPEHHYFAVAVVYKNSSINKFEDFLGKKACCPGDNTVLERDSLAKSAICSGNELKFIAGHSNAATKVKRKSKSISGHTKALRCLVQGEGDVAFLDRNIVADNADGKNSEDWKRNFRPDDFELVCPTGERAALSDYEKCHLFQLPTKMILTSNTKYVSSKDEIRGALISLGKIYYDQPNIFKLFGPFNGKNNLLFTDSATGFISQENQWLSSEGLF